MFTIYVYYLIISWQLRTAQCTENISCLRNNVDIMLLKGKVTIMWFLNMIFKYNLKYGYKKNFVSDSHSTILCIKTFNDLMLWLKTKETDCLPQTKIVQSIIFKWLKGCEYKLRRKVWIFPT